MLESRAYLLVACPRNRGQAHRAKSTPRVEARGCSARNKSPVVRRLQILRANSPASLPINRAPSNDRPRASPAAPAIAGPLYPFPQAIHLPRATVRSVCAPAPLLRAARIFARVRKARIRLYPADPLRPAAKRCGSKAPPVPADPFDCAEKLGPAAPAPLRAENQNIFRG